MSALCQNNWNCFSILTIKTPCFFTDLRYNICLRFVRQVIMKAMDQDTIYLNSVPGMTESLLQGKATPLEECLSESEVEW